MRRTSELDGKRLERAALPRGLGHAHAYASVRGDECVCFRDELGDDDAPVTEFIV